MRPSGSKAILLLSLAVAATSLAACGGGSDEPGGGGGDGGGTYVDGKTFTYAMGSDPGALDPQSSALSSAIQLAQFAYDPLVHINASGEIQPGLAASWTADDKTVTFEIADGITCADGAPFTADTVAANIAWVEDPKNKSPFLGVFIPPGATASASGSTVTVKLAAPSPFVLNGFANLPMVCDSGLADRASLKTTTAGTGPYTLKEAVSGDHYTYELREGYTWGPNGATTAEKGMPAVIEAKVVSNETTAANQLISGELNSATILGPDAKRLSAAKMDAETMEMMTGEQWYNHGEGHATSDPVVRLALTQALDLAELQKVITSGTGAPATGLAILAPAACPGNSVEGNVPEFDVDAAAAALAEAGWTKDSDGVLAKDGKKLSISFIYDSVLGTGATAASELVVEAWKALGVDVTSKSATTADLEPILFGTGDWDVAWEPVNVSSPDQMVPFYSGPGPADGGTNFANIENGDYTASVEAAMAKPGVDGCSDWTAAEAALFKAADVVPFANNVTSVFHKGAEFELIGWLIPTSIRMLG